MSALPPVVAATVEQSYGHHRTRWFESILDDIGSWVTRAVGGGTPLILTATVSGAREAVVANCLAPGDTAWAGPDSSFAAHVSIADGVAVPWTGEGTPSASDSPQLVLLDHVTEDGGLLDVRTACSEIRRAASGAVIVLDASVSFGADVASFADVDLDGVILGPEGALMGIPGLSILVARERLLDLARARRAALSHKPFYLDLLRYEKVWAKRTTPYSPNISATVALGKSIELIEANGGLAAHVARHAERAARVRRELGSAVARGREGRRTSAFTVLQATPGSDALALARKFAGTSVHAEPIGLDRLRVDHTGYLPPGALSEACARLREALGTDPQATAGDFSSSREGSAASASIADVRLPVDVLPNLPPERPWDIFEIPAKEFVSQARTHAKREGGGDVYEARIAGAASTTFRASHRADPRTLAARTVGFIGAGNIVVHAVEKCRAVGISSLVVYSPSLASAKRSGGQGREDDRSTPLYWESRGVTVASTPDEIWTTAHTIVLLPWFYDAEALGVFGKGAEYLNDTLIDREVLERIEREGRCDVIVNAAARERLVDREALADALAAGWLRYYSDELPPADDPLLAYRNARFTGHVGGSCAQPQAAVARNTHHIMAALARQLRAAGAMDSGEAGTPAADGQAAVGYRINVLNDRVAGRAPWRVPDAVLDAAEPIRVLITDKFDLEALDLDGIAREYGPLEVTNVSNEKPTPESVAAHVRRVRPHVLMVRSRTPVDATVAGAAADVHDLVAIVRPGVGVDNVYGGMQSLTSLGVQVINEPFGNSAAVAEMAVHFIASAAEQVLLAPGPTRFEPDVFAVTAECTHPSDPQFREAQSGVEGGLAGWLGATTTPLVLAASGTGLMEAGITNLTDHGAHGLVISHGKFGDRFIQIAEATGRTAHALRVDDPDWGRAISPEEIGRWLRERSAANEPPISFLCFQQNETSSGIAYRPTQIRAIVQAARAHNPDMMIVADAISGAFAHPLDAGSLDVDLLVVGSQKGLGVSSGLAFGVLSRRAFDRMLELGGLEGSPETWLERPTPDVVDRFERRQHVRYLSLLRLYRDQVLGTWEDPPSVFHVLSTARALERHEGDGGQLAVLERHAEMGRQVRDGLEGAGLRPVADPVYASDSVTPAFLPDGIEAGAVRKRLEAEYGIEIAGAQGDYWAKRMIRIGHFGFVYPSDVARCLRGIRVILRGVAQPEYSEPATR